MASSSLLLRRVVHFGDHDSKWVHFSHNLVPDGMSLVPDRLSLFDPESMFQELKPCLASPGGKCQVLLVDSRDPNVRRLVFHLALSTTDANHSLQQYIYREMSYSCFTQEDRSGTLADCVGKFCWSIGH